MKRRGVRQRGQCYACDLPAAGKAERLTVSAAGRIVRVEHLPACAERHAWAPELLKPATPRRRASAS